MQVSAGCGCVHTPDAQARKQLFGFLVLSAASHCQVCWAGWHVGEQQTANQQLSPSAMVSWKRVLPAVIMHQLCCTPFLFASHNA